MTLQDLYSQLADYGFGVDETANPSDYVEPADWDVNPWADPYFSSDVGGGASYDYSWQNPEEWSPPDIPNEEINLSNLQDITSQENIQDVMMRMFPALAGLLDADDASQFQTFPKSLIKSLDRTTYSPLMQDKQQSLLTQLTSPKTQRGLQRATGGAAASGQYERAKKDVKDVYSKGFLPTLTSIGSSQQEGFGKTQDIITSWLDTAQSYL